jgi:two-component system sensor histidine kinase PilS (NtrC family)
LVNTEKKFNSFLIADDENFIIFFIRLSLFAAFFLIFQSVILIQKPFLHVEFIYAFYLTMGIQFAIYGLAIFLKRHADYVHYILDIGLMYYLFNSQPQYASYYFIYLVVNLFFAGLQLNTIKVVSLCFLSSILLSVINLKTIHWTGAQNLLTLSLFNFTFIAAIFISTQFKSEVSFLKKSLSDSNIKLQSKLDLSKLLIEQIPLGIFATDSQNRVLFSNQALIDKMNLNYQTAQEIINTAGLKSQALVYNSQLAEKRYYEIEQASYFDQEMKDQVQVNLIKDVTDVVLLQEQMKQKEKMAAVGQLAAGIAHEIRNPLAGISGSIELLSQEKSDPDEQKLMKIILREIDRLNNLITEFLDYSKPDKVPDQPVDLSFILDEVAQNIRNHPELSKNLKLNMNISKAVVLGFSDKLKQGFLNIVMNAVQAMKDQSEPQLVIATEQNTHHVIVRIKDNGSGMTETVKNRIFEPFFTTKSKGTGLGMAITHKVFDSHQAKIEIDSQIGVGTEFKIIFNKI